MLGTLASIMTGLLISAISSSREMAVILVPLVLIPQVMFSGAITHISDMNNPGKVVSIVTASRWTYHALGNTTKMNDYIKAPVLPVLPNQKETKKEYFDDNFNTDKTTDWQILAIMSLILFMFTLLMVKLKDNY